MSSLTGLGQDLKVIYHLLKPIQGDNHKERLENFYQGQATNYDSFRKRLLQGREELYQTLIDSTNSQSIWLDMGGGTGANLETIASQLNQLQKLYIVDLCAPLLQIAKDRMVTHQWSNVEAIEADVTTFIPPEQQVDVVTFSYSLTMIPDWFKALDQALSLLKPGGTIGVVDFYVSRKYPAHQGFTHSVWSRHFWPTWFAKDNVFLSSEHAPYLHYRFESVKFIERMAALPFLPGVQVPYYLFIGRKPG
jgi:S-adenosylmethionine-diacylgycerolhomoserine-N-methlytransferase